MKNISEKLDKLQISMDKAWEKSPEYKSKTVLGVKGLSASDMEELDIAIDWIRKHGKYLTYNSLVTEVLAKAGFPGMGD